MTRNSIILLLLLLAGVAPLRAEDEMVKTFKYTSLNRAAGAVVSASSYRKGGLSEVVGGSMMLYAPQVRSWWIPEYAVDKDSETYWACRKSSGEWFQVELGNKLMPLAPVKRVVVFWGKHPPDRYSLLYSKDGRNFEILKSMFFEQSGPLVIELEQPREMSSLKLEFYSGLSKGVSIREIQVYGPDHEPMPSMATGIKAELLSAREVRLSWGIGKNGGPVYLFKIHRSASPHFVAGASNLIEETDRTEFVDRSVKPGVTYYYKVASEGFSGDKNLSAPSVAVSVQPGEAYYRMQFRGVIEGFYNQPWAHPERVRMIRFLAQNNCNYYIYAPKNDPYHRQLWRKSYPEDEKKNFAELVQTANAVGLTFNYGISPGLNINYHDPAEIDKLKSKLKEMFDLGVRAFTLCLDDIPDSDNADEKMARDQTKVVNELNQWLKSLDSKCTLFFVPTVYSYPYSYQVEKNKNFARYLEVIAGVDPEVLMMWTGPSSVFSDNIDLKSAAEYKKLWDRKILIWDNYPVNDVGLQNFAFLGPYLGREPGLGEAVAGIFSNPMFLPNASRPALFTMGEYFSVEDYDAWQAYGQAMPAVGAGAESALKDLADCLLNHPRFPSRDLAALPVKKMIDAFWAAKSSGDYQNEAGQLRALLERYANNPEQLSQLDNQRLWFELKPFSEKLSTYAKASLLALDYAESKDSAKKDQAEKLLKPAGKIRFRVAENKVTVIYSLIGAKSGTPPVFEEFVKKALK
jgi:hyaluronoglucosaminidase